MLEIYRERHTFVPGEARGSWKGELFCWCWLRYLFFLLFFTHTHKTSHYCTKFPLLYLPHRCCSCWWPNSQKRNCKKILIRRAQCAIFDMLICRALHTLLFEQLEHFSHRAISVPFLLFFLCTGQRLCAKWRKRRGGGWTKDFIRLLFKRREGGGGLFCYPFHASVWPRSDSFGRPPALPSFLSGLLVTQAIFFREKIRFEINKRGENDVFGTKRSFFRRTLLKRRWFPSNQYRRPCKWRNSRRYKMSPHKWLRWTLSESFPNVSLPEVGSLFSPLLRKHCF